MLTVLLEPEDHPRSQRTNRKRHQGAERRHCSVECWSPTDSQTWETTARIRWQFCDLGADGVVTRADVTPIASPA